MYWACLVGGVSRLTCLPFGDWVACWAESDAGSCQRGRLASVATDFRKPSLSPISSIFLFLGKVLATLANDRKRPRSLEDLLPVPLATFGNTGSARAKKASKWVLRRRLGAIGGPVIVKTPDNVAANGSGERSSGN